MAERPSTCENPVADCRRTPTRKAEGSEDLTSDTPHVEKYLCTPCSSMLERGTVIAPNELSLISLPSEADR